MISHKKFFASWLFMLILISNTAFALNYTEIEKTKVIDDIISYMGNYHQSNFERVTDDVDKHWLKMIETNIGYTNDFKLEGRILASHAGYDNEFGYINNNGDFIQLFDAPQTKWQIVNSNSLEQTPFIEFEMTLPSDMVHLAIRSENEKNYPWIWTSNPDLNDDSLDHMVTWINSLNPLHYIIGFEDLHGFKRNSDWDFNDLVVELRYIYTGSGPIPTPEPGTLLLLGLGLCGLYLTRVKRMI
ncbi:PEP-CTERM protein-sorting domain-containing protein [Desulfonatronum thiosulfatophilum]|uniref:PEP-CTERM protein-sorting domain-containing protein n=1 Tax=Desulfonatronum thiosulfatophilum TaxID=617002 RepID=A0A1G6DPA6_9BACT|nr:DUF4114 domain-containing protein [Desulfonatronum thiosulfatophilum]SDB46941.1 PEP-CTERM protein-sorting domain-containing protein [Desulfonatronum thiosulfatophilum]